MRTLKKRNQKVWFCEVTQVLEGLNNKNIYSEPVLYKVGVSPTAGDIAMYGNGLELTYDRYIHWYDMKNIPKEGTMVFVDVVPEIGEDGQLVTEEVPVLKPDGTQRLDVDGNPITTVKTLTEPDYLIDRVYQTQRGSVARLMLKRVSDAK